MLPILHQDIPQATTHHIQNLLTHLLILAVVDLEEVVGHHYLIQIQILNLFITVAVDIHLLFHLLTQHTHQILHHLMMDTDMAIMILTMIHMDIIDLFIIMDHVFHLQLKLLPKIEESFK